MKVQSRILMDCIEDYAKATAQKFYAGDQGVGDDLITATAEYNIAAQNLRLALARKPMTVSFAIGDVVKVRSKIREIPTGLRRKRGEKLIITDTSLRENGTMEYAVSGSAWHGHDKLTLVSRAIPATLRKAYSLGRDDEENEDEEV